MSELMTAEPEATIYREIPGLGGYFLGSDRSCWSSKSRGRPARSGRRSPQWKPKAPDRTSPSTVMLWDGSKTIRLKLDAAYAAVFPEFSAN